MLSIIIVNYRTPKLVIDCINSIIIQTSKTEYEIIVVDNFSGDDSISIITQAHPNVAIISMSYNTGFSRANNAGMQQAKGEIVLLLNSDTIVLDNALDKCVQSFIETPYVACGLQLLNTNGTLQVSGQWFYTGNINMALKLPYLQMAYNFMKTKTGKKDKNFDKNRKPVTEVDWINGAFLMVKKDIVTKAGLMDEDFFLYAEEAEWCSRIGKYGKLCLFNNSHVIHLQGESVSASVKEAEKGYSNIYDKKGFQFLVSSYLHVRKQYGIVWLFINYFIQLFYIPIVVLILLGDKLVNGAKALYTWRNLKGFAINTGKCLHYIIKMVTNRPFFYKVI